MLLLALLLAADASNGLVAVLEFRNKLKGGDRESVDAGYFTDQVRAAVREQAPQLKVITRENEQSLLAAQGKKLEDCGELCEVDTGRFLSADFVVSGELLKVGTSFKLNMRLHETEGGSLLTGATASGKTIDELDAATPAAVTKLVAALPRPRGPPRYALTTGGEALGAMRMIKLSVNIDGAPMYSRASEEGLELPDEIPLYNGQVAAGAHDVELALTLRHVNGGEPVSGVARFKFNATPGAQISQRVVWYGTPKGLQYRVE
jgi:hypothetical protein